MKSWWSGLTLAQQQEWYLTQQRVLVQGGKRRFDQIEYKERTVDQAADIVDDVERGITYAVYRRRMKDDNPGIKDSAVEAAWLEDLMDTSKEAVFENNQWQLIEYEGIERRRRRARINESESERSRVIDNQSDLQAFQRAGHELINSYHAGIALTQNRSRVRAPQADVSVSEQPHRPAAPDVMDSAVSRETLAMARQEAQRKELEAADSMAATLATNANNGGSASGKGKGKGKGALEKLQVSQAVDRFKVKCESKAEELTSKTNELKAKLLAAAGDDNKDAVDTVCTEVAELAEKGVDYLKGLIHRSVAMKAQVRFGII